MIEIVFRKIFDSVSAAKEYLESLEDSYDTPIPDPVDIPDNPIEFPEEEVDNSNYPIYDHLSSNPGCVVRGSFRSQSYIDSLPTNRKENQPVIYDPSKDAARWHINTNTGSTGTMQKRPYIRFSGGTSFLLYWEFMFDSSWAFVPGMLDQHKTWKIMDEKDDLFLSFKTDYAGGRKFDGAVAHFKTTVNTKYIVPGESFRGSSEMLEPRNADYYILPDTWNSVFLFLDGEIKQGNKLQLSMWINKVHLFDKIAFLSPQMLKQFHIFYDSSMKQDKISVPQISSSWNRNLAGVKNLSYDEVISLVEQ